MPVSSRQYAALTMAIAVSCGVCTHASRSGPPAPPPIADPTAFANWESPTVDPMAITPDGTTLLVVNLPDHHLELFDIRFDTPVRIGSVPVGLDPVSVTAQSDDVAWVVNHVSDSISIVDLNTLDVTRTLLTDDEPCDVVFAGIPERAFVSISQGDAVQVFDPAALNEAPLRLEIDGRSPRDLATDGTHVFAAIFESGNLSTVLSETQTSSLGNPYPGDQNPPPNAEAIFLPPLGQDLPNPPRLGMIVQRRPSGAWMDDNGRSWSGLVTWGLHDHDVAILRADDLTIRYATGLQHANMALSVRPDGVVTVVGTDVSNTVRYAPNLAGRFLQTRLVQFDPLDTTDRTTSDLNPHLGAGASSVAPAVREMSLATPRAIVWTPDGSSAFIAGMGSNNVIEVDTSGQRLTRIDVGAGPSGLALDAPRDRLYVLNRFDGTIDVIGLVDRSVIGRVHLHDPTPDVIRTGRRALYDAHALSGTGHVSCASCHIDARHDGLAWDIGDPAGSIPQRDAECDERVPDAGGCGIPHPMGGPLRTLSLVGATRATGLNARADAPDLHAISQKYTELLGADLEPDADTTDALAAFLAAIASPPHPNRRIDGSLPTSMGNGGDPVRGQHLFNTLPSMVGGLTCADCHGDNRPIGGLVVAGGALGLSQSFRAPSLHLAHERAGFDPGSNAGRRGFGYGHDGSISSVRAYLSLPRFSLSEQERLDLEAYVHCFGTDTFAGVGAQCTIGGPAGSAQSARFGELVAIATDGHAELVVTGRLDGVRRGFLLNPATGRFDSDRAGESIGIAGLRNLADANQPLTATLVPIGSGERLALDRDQDGVFNTDETDVCTNPADPVATPGGPFSPDQDGNGVIDIADLRRFLTSWLILEGDYDRSGEIDLVDLLVFLTDWFACSA